MSIDFSAHAVEPPSYWFKRFRARKPNTYACSFEVTCWSHHLAITGDLGCALLRVYGMEDILRKFDLPGQVNYAYWAEKAEAGGTGGVWCFDGASMVSALLKDGVIRSYPVGFTDLAHCTNEIEAADLLDQFDLDIDVAASLDCGRVISPQFTNQCDAIAWLKQHLYCKPDATPAQGGDEQ